MHISDRNNLRLHSTIQVFFLIKLFLFLVEKLGLGDEKFLKCFKENPGTACLKKLGVSEHLLTETWDFENTLWREGLFTTAVSILKAWGYRHPSESAFRLSTGSNSPSSSEKDSKWNFLICYSCFKGKKFEKQLLKKGKLVKMVKT